MRPTTHELLESARHSLRDVVLPAVDDEWARYVAKCTDKLLAAVQVRLARELELAGHRHGRDGRGCWLVSRCRSPLS